MTTTLALITMLNAHVLAGDCQGQATLTCENKHYAVELFNAQETLELLKLNFNNSGVTSCFFDVQDQGNWCGSRGEFEFEFKDGALDSFQLLRAWSWVE